MCLCVRHPSEVLNFFDGLPSALSLTEWEGVCFFPQQVPVVVCCFRFSLLERQLEISI